MIFLWCNFKLMNLFANNRKWLVIGLLVSAVTLYAFFSFEKKVDFSTEVKPILNKKCIACHGGVKAKAGFSVLFREEALAKTESGKYGIVPGDPDASELIRRINLTDPEERMPYRHEPLSKEEISTLRRWIKQGAEWGQHWAWVPVKKTDVPELEDDWIRNDVDKFILEKLKDEKLQPSPVAEKPVLLRRVSLDLTGVYPSDQLAKKFLQSNDDNAYESLVDSLLASPRFGERWASMWLDLARYADTKGYEADGNRNIWRYRDWVIDAFNSGKPYNEFLVEQIAGDLLPDPTDAQYIATAFHRNSMTNDEGGTNNEEFRTAAAMDRVSTTWEALMSTTFSCVQCHSHPYDPIRHDEYYKFLAYFNDTRDEDVQNEYPVLRQFSDSSKKEMDQLLKWVSENSTAEQTKKIRLLLRTFQPSINSTTADSLKNGVISNNNSDLMVRDHAVARLKNVDLNDATQLFWRYYTVKKGGTLSLRLDRPDGPVITTTKVISGERSQTGIIDFEKQKGVHDVYLTYENPSFKSEIEFALFFDWFSFNPAFPGKDSPGYETNKKRYIELMKADFPGTPVMVENPAGMHRSTHVFLRGNRMTLGKEVTPSVPASFGFAMPKGAPANRMGLAMWLTDKKNPLVSRTIVNRLWEQLFGTGLVETLEDMGTQGIAPTHRELLDHLSWKFVNEYNWSMKKLLKELLMSATYRQDSKLPEELKKKDPNNKLYARNSRVRLSAEQLRDQHLCISGLLSNKMHGQGVMPWQPEGIWLSPYNGAKWKKSSGEEQYRRAVYTFWKRTSPYPSMISFDAAQRVVCNARRIRTNTPLQALVTLNDSAYLDIARHFAFRMKKEAGDDPGAQISRGYELMVFKPISAPKLKLMLDLYEKALKEFDHNKDQTCKMVGGVKEYDNPPTAALVVVANTMLNLDEVVMKQ
jgi:uncharacterized short protein YbdD (DUF466 family)